MRRLDSRQALVPRPWVRAPATGPGSGVEAEPSQKARLLRGLGMTDDLDQPGRSSAACLLVALL